MFRRIAHHPYLELPELGEPVSFSFNGRRLDAYTSDTVTTALLANGITLLSRSFKLHRPRSLYDGAGLGPETLVTIDGTPNELADRVRVRQGMQIKTQNAWPSVEFDLMAATGLIVPRLPNMFYYKLFHRPRWLWPLAEQVIRRIAGLGQIDRQAAIALEAEAERRYEKRYRFPDVCVVGGGPAGLAAAEAALAAGAQVLLLDDQLELGGHCRYSLDPVAGCAQPALNPHSEAEAVRQLVAQLKAHPQLEVLSQASAFGLYEGNLVAAQQGDDLFKIRAGAVVLATGASDRHLVFQNNDLPGIVTARAIARLIGGHRLAPSQNAVVITCHDGGYQSALLLSGAGTAVQAVIDARPAGAAGPYEQQLRQLGIPIYYEQTIQAAWGDRWVATIDIGSLDGQRQLRSFACDLVVMAVGFKPQLSLLAGSHRPRWDPQRQIFRVYDLPEAVYAAGEVNGNASFSQLYAEGYAAGTAAAQQLAPPPSVRASSDAIWALPADIEAGGSQHFICKCMDVTRQELRYSTAEGFDAVETLKRYTSMGMGPCQGKQCYEAVARLAAQDTGVTAAAAVPTTLRPPFSPVSFGVLAGRSRQLQPVARSPMHSCHEAAGASFISAGRWRRPYAYGDPQQEAQHVRSALGLIDISTLGKLELSGPDALAFLQFLLPGKYAKLAVGRTRYSVMVGEDGILFEDGTLSRLDDSCYYLTTTSSNQEAINALIQWWLTVEPFDVRFRNLSAVYAAVNVAGPQARAFLQSLVDIDLSNAALPYMSCRQARLAQVPVWLFRIGFTGELGYELHFPAEYGEALWRYLQAQGQPFDLRPFGLEAQRILRLEKGHLIPGLDTDALSHPFAAGVGFAVALDKPNFVGKAALTAFQQQSTSDRLVPFALLDPAAPIPEDGLIALLEGSVIGRVTSSRRSPTLGKGIGLAWLAAPQAQPGQHFTIRLSSGQAVQATVLAQPAYDPDGLRLKA